jgi:hypothetical protein
MGVGQERRAWAGGRPITQLIVPVRHRLLIENALQRVHVTSIDQLHLTWSGRCFTNCPR